MRIVLVGDSLTQGLPGCSYVNVLREALPGHSLVNLGVGNDTVISLYRRMRRLRVRELYDVAVLWVGVNDVGGDSSWPARLANALRRQPRSRDLEAFQGTYGLILDLLCSRAERVVAVSPALRGEDVSNKWNREIAAMSAAIAGLASRRERVAYLGLRTVFAHRLHGRQVSGYLPDNWLRVVLDVLTLRSSDQVDRKAAERGLHFTLDGVHLNSAGAQIVALEVLGAIQRAAGDVLDRTGGA